MHKYPGRWVLIISIIALCYSGITFALRVAPGSFSTQYVPLGHPQDLGITLVCNGEGAKFIAVAVIGPESEDLPHCVGYDPLPETEWFVVDDDTFAVDSVGDARSKLAVNIPDKPEHYNQHFIVRLFVTGGGSGMFQPAIIPYYFVETPPKANPLVPPLGILAIAPSVVDLNADIPTGDFVIYNNDTTKHTYSLIVRKPEKTSRRFPNLSYSSEAIHDTTTLTIFPKTIRIPAKQTSKISVRWLEAGAVQTPTEAIILITADDGKTSFVRVKMRLKEE